MTSPPEHAEPRKDTAEQRTRLTYTAWMQHGLEVVKELAQARPEPVRWPEPRRSGASLEHIGAAGLHATPRMPLTAHPPRPELSISAALRRGWLVATDSTDRGSTAAEPPPAAASPAGPLAELTVAVKDVIDVAGLPSRNGTTGALWREPVRSAEAWTRLAAAGARCVGKAATHEMAWGVTTPQIAHPLSEQHITGGSSGGSAACVAAGVATAGLGTDTGGSVRIPAALCGVVGVRPTTGSIDMAGITPLAPEQDVVGPMAADVATCTSVLEVLLDRPLHPSEPPGTASRGMRIGILARPGRLEPAVESAFLDTVECLRDAGVGVIECDTLLARQAGSISLLTMLHSSARLYSQTVQENFAGFGGEARALLTVGDAMTEQDAEVLRHGRDTLVSGTARLFAENRLDALLTPTTPCTAPRRFAEEVEIAHRSDPVSAALTRFTAWASATSMAAVSIPVNTPGLPVGVQVMAPPGHEATCVRLAFTIEEHTRRKAT